MLAIFNVTAPFFALVLCGYLAARARLLPDNAVPALNGFVLYFALPCMLFRFTANTPLAQLLNLHIFSTYLAAGLITLGFTAFALVYGHGERVRDAALGALAVAWSNWGYMGFALIPPLLGPQATATIIAAGLGDLTVILVIALSLATVGDAQGGGPKAALVAALRGVSKNPLIWSVLVGVVFSAADAKLPVALDTFVRLLATGAGPVALFAIGVSLYRAPAASPASATTASAAAQAVASNPLLQGDVLFLTFAKLVLHPYLLLVVATFAHVPAEAKHVLVLVAALPAAGTVFLLAGRHGANAERIASVILLTTALAFFTFSLMLYLVGATPKVL